MIGSTPFRHQDSRITTCEYCGQKLLRHGPTCPLKMKAIEKEIVCPRCESYDILKSYDFDKGEYWYICLVCGNIRFDNEKCS